jgi:hypothetical protein
LDVFGVEMVQEGVLVRGLHGLRIQHHS